MDSPEGVCAGRAWFEYPATSVLLKPGRSPVVVGGHVAPSTRQLDLDPIRVMHAPEVALGGSTLRGRRDLDALHHEPNNGPSPFQGPAPPLLNCPFIVQGFSQGLGVPVHDTPSLKRLLLPLDLGPQLPIAFGRQPLHPLWWIEGGPFQCQFVIFQLGVTSVDSSNLGRFKLVLIQQRLGT